MGVFVCPSLLFSNRQNEPSVCSPETSRFMTTPASTNSLGSGLCFIDPIPVRMATQFGCGHARHVSTQVPREDAGATPRSLRGRRGKDQTDCSIFFGARVPIAEPL